MPQFEHGLYEPGEDVKLFDGSEEEEEVENSRLPLLIVLALLVLAMFAGFVWLAYNEGVARGRSENPLLASDQAAPKTAANTGGSSQAYKGFKIYEQPAPPDDDTGVTAAARPAQSVPAKPAAKPEPAANLPVKAATPAKPAPQPQAKAASIPQPAAKGATPAPPAAKPAAAPPAQASAPPRPLAAPAATSATSAAPPAEAYVLQIGAYKSQGEADTAWTVYKTKHSALLAGFTPNVVQADLGDKGVWYRLRIAGFSSKDAASGLCDRLKADGGACFLGK